MKYPVELNFKKIALAKQATLTESDGNSIAYARQKILKLKEELEIFEDKTKAKRICTIKANKVIEIDQIRVLLHLEVSDTVNIECCILEIFSNTS